MSEESQSALYQGHGAELGDYTDIEAAPEELSYVPMCRECGKLSPLGWGCNYAQEGTARERAGNHEADTGHTVDILEIKP